MAELTDLVRYEIEVKRVNAPTDNEYDTIVKLRGNTKYVLGGMDGISEQISDDSQLAVTEFNRLKQQRERKGQDKKQQK